MRSAASSPFPYDTAFYTDLVAGRHAFTTAWQYEVPPLSGYGFRVDAGQVFRLVMSHGATVADLCIYSAADPDEHYAAGAQLYIEGGRVTRGTRIWGTPPRSRPLAFITADTVRARSEGGGAGLREPARQHHKCFGAHCNPHHWLLFAGIHPPTCYDNLRDACAQLGMSQHVIHDNLNLFGRFAMDPEDGLYTPEPTQAERGDYLEFYAEIDLLLALSACPYGYQATPPEQWARKQIAARPIAIHVLDTHIAPQPWPHG